MATFFGILFLLLIVNIVMFLVSTDRAKKS